MKGNIVVITTKGARKGRRVGNPARQYYSEEYIMSINEAMKWPTNKEQYDKNYDLIFGSKEKNDIEKNQKSKSKSEELIEWCRKFMEAQDK